MEIERKFLLDKEKMSIKGLDKVFNNIDSMKTIAQYYISKEPEVRIRKTHKTTYTKTNKGRLTETYSKTTTMTRKSSDYNLSRNEKTKKIYSDYFNELSLFKILPTIHKTRYTLKSGEEIDIFEDLDLCLMEKEFNSVADSKDYKALFNDYLIREVTGEGEYYNFEIAKEIESRKD